MLENSHWSNESIDILDLLHYYCDTGQAHNVKNQASCSLLYNIRIFFQLSNSLFLLGNI